MLIFLLSNSINFEEHFSFFFWLYTGVFFEELLCYSVGFEFAASCQLLQHLQGCQQFRGLLLTVQVYIVQQTTRAAPGPLQWDSKQLPPQKKLVARAFSDPYFFLTLDPKFSSQIQKSPFNPCPFSDVFPERVCSFITLRSVFSCFCSTHLKPSLAMTKEIQLNQARERMAKKRV